MSNTPNFGKDRVADILQLPNKTDDQRAVKIEELRADNAERLTALEAQGLSLGGPGTILLQRFELLVTMLPEDLKLDFELAWANAIAATLDAAEAELDARSQPQLILPEGAGKIVETKVVPDLEGKDL